MMWTGECTMSYATDRILSDFGKSAMALAERLEEDPRFGLIEQVFIENHMHILFNRLIAAGSDGIYTKPAANERSPFKADETRD